MPTVRTTSGITTSGSRAAVAGTLPLMNSCSSSSTTMFINRWNNAEKVMLQTRISSGNTTRFT
ncbi:hypothetical protein D3C72_2457390 [compost metagenome]